MFKSKTSLTGRFLRHLQLVGRVNGDGDDADNDGTSTVDEATSQQQVPRQDYLTPECHRTYSCIHCRAHLADHDELVSKLFQGNHGRAYLFNKVVNVGCKQAVERELLTGLHAVSDIYCDCCETTLGWKYEQAFVASQKYKEGKYIIELVHMLKENNWDLTSYNSEHLLSTSMDDTINNNNNLNDDMMINHHHHHHLKTTSTLADERDLYVKPYLRRKTTPTWNS